jgi:thiamine biosynthesis lipoprotein apbE
MERGLYYLPLISLFFLTFASCSKDFFSSDGKTWGTSYHIVYDGDHNLDEEIEATLALVDTELSMFNSNSLVSRINSGQDSLASEHFTRVFNLSQRISKISGGVYDPTVGPLSDLWGFGRNEIVTEPADSAVAATLAYVGIADCAISEDGIVSKKNRSTVFDFSSIAKGYGIDLVGKLLEDNDVENYMIEIGGEILVRGRNPKGKPWHIQIDSPESGFGHERMDILELGPDKTATASSGNYRNFRRRSDGTLYGHTLSPLTGYPVDGSIAAVTIIASDCATADGMATACMAAASPDSALAIAGRAAVKAILVCMEADSLKVIKNF